MKAYRQYTYPILHLFPNVLRALQSQSIFFMKKWTLLLGVARIDITFPTPYSFIHPLSYVLFPLQTLSDFPSIHVMRIVWASRPLFGIISCFLQRADALPMLHIN